MNDMNKFLTMSMRKEDPCEDKAPEKECRKWKQYCDSEKFAKICKKTCGLCQKKCHDTLENLHCLSKG